MYNFFVKLILMTKNILGNNSDLSPLLFDASHFSANFIFTQMLYFTKQTKKNKTEKETKDV